MIASRVSRFRRRPLLAAVFLAAGLACVTSASVTDAKGPAPEPAFTISAFTNGWDWVDLIKGSVGKFSVTGDIADAGDIYYLDSFRDASGVLWHRCVFASDAGSFETMLPAWPSNNEAYAFELFNGTGAYAGLQATGVTKAHAQEKFFWYDDDLTIKKIKWTYLDVSWSIDGYLNS